MIYVSGDMNFCLVPDGFYYMCARSYPKGDDTYHFEYHYSAYVKGHWDTTKEERMVTTVLKPCETQTIYFTRTKWAYATGGYNDRQYLNVTLLPLEEMYKKIKKEPSYQYGYLLLALNKNDEFIKCLNSIKEEPKDNYWSIYDDDIFAMFSLAYAYGVGREKDKKRAVLNAFRCFNLGPAKPFLELGYGKKTLKNPEYLLEETEGFDNNGSEYLMGNALIEEGFKVAGEQRIIWGSECLHVDYPEFYDPSNKKGQHYQALLHKQAAEILINREGKMYSAIENYGTYLAYKKYGTDQKIYYKESVNYGDEWESDWREVNAINRNLIKELIREAANEGDKFAKQLVKHLEK